MTTVNTLYTASLGFATIFFWIGLGMIFLRKSSEEAIGLGYWAASFFLNSAGFLLGAGIITSKLDQFFTNGQAFQMLGLIALACGTYRFAGNEFRQWNIYALGGVTIAWLVAMVLTKYSLHVGYILLVVVYGIVGIWTGTLVLRHKSTKSLSGHGVAGWALVSWGGYTILYPLIYKFPWLVPLGIGFLVGLHVLASIGMVIMVVSRMRIRAEISESHALQLEVILPICAKCKKIQDDQNNWQSVESYVSKHSKAGFTRTICPECFEKYSQI
jgi:hypothetical protein